MDLCSILRYDNGDLYWRDSGLVATYLSRHGSLYVRLPNQSTRPAHIIVWEMHKREYARFLEHIDGNILNNHIDNLCSKGAGIRPTQDFVTSRFYYDGKDLRFRSTNKLVGTVSKEGYRRFSLSNRIFGVHQLVWLYHHGVIPPEIDHINQNKLDNSLENLREVTKAQNRWNMPGRNPDKKQKGVYLAKNKTSYQVRITHLGCCKSYGQFDTEEEANNMARRVYEELQSI